MAQQYDRHVLYQRAVQTVDVEIDFVDATYRKLRGRRAKVLREDFCGTANTACEWVRRRRDNQAYAVDLDASVLAWGREHNVNRLPPAARERIQLLNRNVLSARTPPVDIVLAMNFSYYIFKRREEMRRYFRSVRRSLARGGVFFLDCYGGYEAFKEMSERRRISKNVTYVWEQERYNPITGDIRCHITFRFADGSSMRRAFSYEWRLWTLPELREILQEAGFRRSTVYWEGTDERTGEGDGNFTPAEEGDADAGWICYLVAEA